MVPGINVADHFAKAEEDVASVRQISCSSMLPMQREDLVLVDEIGDVVRVEDDGSCPAPAVVIGEPDHGFLQWN